MIKHVTWLICLLQLWSRSNCLDNGLARTPPMGWLHWERFRCNVDCVNDPDHCISEKLFMQMADRLVADGYMQAGYSYVNIDDCWLADSRDSKGRLQPNAKRFPNGMPALAKYIHDKGLKFGIYEDLGTHTCGGYPGSEYHLEMDANTFADWGVDFLKLDGCYNVPSSFDDAYPAMSFWLNQTGRPILYSCSWPAYQEGHQKPDYARIAKYCNIWRNYGDISDSWSSVASIIEFYGNDDTKFAEVAGPGNFNDPDMLIIGNYGLSYDQQRSQMALWCIMASPLLVSVDLRSIRKESRDLLINKGAIAVNQDRLGIQGRRISKAGNIQIWTRPILPQGSMAFVFLNMGNDVPNKVSFKLSDLGLSSAAGYMVTEVFTGASLGKMTANSTISQYVNPTGVFFGKATSLG